MKAVGVRVLTHLIFTCLLFDVRTALDDVDQLFVQNKFPATDSGEVYD